MAWPARPWDSNADAGQHVSNRIASLALYLPLQQSLKAVAVGVSSGKSSQFHQDFVIWFRPEVIETVDVGWQPP